MAGPFRIIDEAADDRMAGASSIWSYAPRILAYPLSGYCLPVLLGGAPVVWMLAQTLQAFAGGEPYSMIAALMRITVVVIGCSWLLSYTLRVIGFTASGHATPPPMAGDTLYNSGLWLMRAVPYPAAFVSLYFTLSPLNAQLAYGAAAFGLLLWPAHALCLATEGSVFASVNPLRLLRIVAGTGALYALVCGVIAAAVWAVSLYASNAYGLLSSAAGLYLLLMICHLLGVSAFRRHRQLDLIVEVGDPLNKAQWREQAQRLDGVLARIESCILRGDLDGAGRELYAEPGGPASVRQFHEDLFARLLARGKLPLILAQGQRLVSLLLNEKRTARALEVYENCLNRDAHFEPETPQQLEVLAREALTSKLDDLFLKMLRNIDTRYPGDLIVVDAGLMQARYWAERHNDDERARQILQPLLEHTAHPRHAQVAALARVLTRSAAPR